MPPKGWSKVPVEEFRLAWEDPRNTAPMLATQFGVSTRTLFALAKRLGLPPRMPVLERLRLPPFGKRSAA